MRVNGIREMLVSSVELIALGRIIPSHRANLTTLGFEGADRRLRFSLLSWFR
jgi:hypothetical protein